MKYKIFFHEGEELGLKDKVRRGSASMSDTALLIEETPNISISFTEITEVRLFRLHGLGRVIQVDYAGRRVFISVVRFMIGQLAFINFFETGDMYEKLQTATDNR